MKQYIKYIMIVLLALVLHDGADSSNRQRRLPGMQADAECCFLSQAPTQTQQAIQEFYRHLNDLSLCLDGCDHHSLVPSIKCIYLWAKYLLVEGGRNDAEWHFLSQADSPQFSHPQDYYIFTLRKIVI